MTAPETRVESAPREPKVTTTPQERRKVLVATLVGTTVEWYDFFIYAFSASLIFNKLFFSALGPTGATLASAASIGISFLFRPLGAFLAGHLGDRYGRKPVLVGTLILMGMATALIGVLPTGEGIAGFSAVALIILRILQGVSAGGEWGGAVLLAVETAEPGTRNRAGAWPQLGVPFGMLLATGMLAVLQSTLGKEAFMEWGWRIPFLVSLLLVLIGYLVRRTVEDSPVFLEIAEKAKRSSAPIGVVFGSHFLLVVFAALVFAGNNAVGYMLTGGVVAKYAGRPLEEGGAVGMDPAQVSLFLNTSAIVWAITTYLAGVIADKTSAKTTFIVGYALQAICAAALWPMVSAAGDNPMMLLLGACLLAIPLGLTYGPLSAWYAESFPASIRFSGVSITYAIGAILGGAFAPLIVQAIFEATGGEWMWAAVYLVGMSLLGLLGSVLLPNRDQIPLGIDMEQSGAWKEWRAGDAVPQGVKSMH